MIRRPPPRPPTDRFRVRAFLAMLPLLAASALHAGRGAWEDTPVPHDVHVPHPLPSSAANDVRQVLVAADRTVWAATAGGVFRHSMEGNDWQELRSQEAQPSSSLGPAFCLEGRGEVVWIGTWQGLYRAGPDGIRRIEGIPGPVVAIGLDATRGTVLAGGPIGFHGSGNPAQNRCPSPPAGTWVQLLPGHAELVRVPPGMGLFHALEEGGGGSGSYVRGRGNSASFALRDLTLRPSGELWAAALGGLQVFGTTDSPEPSPPRTSCPPRMSGVWPSTRPDASGPARIQGWPGTTAPAGACDVDAAGCCTTKSGTSPSPLTARPGSQPPEG